MNFKEIQKLIELVSKTGITEFSLEDDGFKLSISNKQEVAENAAAPQIIPIQTPMPMAAPQQFAQPAAPQVAQPVAPVASTPTATPEAPTKSNLIPIKSPIVGTFYRSGGPDQPPFVKEGDRIDPKSVVCIVEAMKLFNEIEAEVSGTIVEVLIKDKTPVEFDQPLFMVDPNG